jgi:peptidoglycan/LPS O-acetylase OafA/YrhL
MSAEAKPTSSRVEFANTLRGLAAVSVLVSHYLGVFWLNRPAVADLTKTPVLPVESFATPGIISTINSLPLINWGAYGVALFFLVSGFVIPFSVSKSTALGFFVNRVFRIYPLYWCGFSITLLALWIAERYFGTGWQFELGNVATHFFPGLRGMMWSQNIDGIIWTLDIEILFYLLCLMSIVAFKRSPPAVFIAPFLLFFFDSWISTKLSVLQATNTFWYIRALTVSHPTPFLIFMYIGTALHFLFIGKIAAERVILLIICLFLMHYALLANGPSPDLVVLVPSYIAALATFVFAMSFPAIFKSNRITNFFADISFPLYVVHGAAGYIGLRILLDRGVPAWASTLLTILCAFTLSWLLHTWIEVRSHKMGKKNEAATSAWWLNLSRK